MKKIIDTYSIKNGNRTRKYAQIQCQDCGSITHERNHLADKALARQCRQCLTDAAPAPSLSDDLRKKVIGTERRIEGGRKRLHRVIECQDCGAITYARRQSCVEASLQAVCISCKGTGVKGGKKALRRSQAAFRKDGRSFHPLYVTYMGMRLRCYHTNHKSYHHYGGRGITVCQEWLDDFWQFVSDVGEKPEGTTLDRIDNDKGYSPDNCRWVDWSTQMKNRRRFKRSKTAQVA